MLGISTPISCGILNGCLKLGNRSHSLPGESSRESSVTVGVAFSVRLALFVCAEERLAHGSR